MSILIFLIVSFGFWQLDAMRYPQMPLAPKQRIEVDSLDAKIMDLLQRKLLLEEFVALMRLHARDTKQRFSPANLKSLHELYNAQRTWNQPCNRDTVSILASVPYILKSLKNESLRSTTYYLLQEHSNQAYAEKCIDDFNDLAQREFSRDEMVVTFMSRLVNFIDKFRRFRLIHAHVYDDMNLNDEQNGKLRKLINSRKFPHELICAETLSKESIVDMNETFKALLGSETGLRTTPIVDRLLRQKRTQNANALKVIVLVAFCEKYQQTRAT